MTEAQSSRSMEVMRQCSSSRLPFCSSKSSRMAAAGLRWHDRYLSEHRGASGLRVSG